MPAPDLADHAAGLNCCRLQARRPGYRVCVL